MTRPVHEREVHLFQLRPGQRFEFVARCTTGKRYPGTYLGYIGGAAWALIDGHPSPTVWSSSALVVPTNEVVPISDLVRPLKQFDWKVNPKEGKKMVAQQAQAQQKAAPARTAAIPIKRESKPRLPVAGQKQAKTAPGLKKAAPAPKALNPCRCGCGQKVARTFAQGHDARFYGWLRRIAAGEELGGIPVSKAVLAELGGQPIQAAKRILKQSGH